MPDSKIFEHLKADHDQHRKLFTKLSKMAADNEKRGPLFEDLRVEIQAHAAAEEESLYATMLSSPDLRDEARHSVAEHKELDDLIGELVDLNVTTAKWTKTFEKLKERYLHHIEEEEEEMFPQASKALSATEEKRLAKIFQDRKPKELEIAEEEEPGDDRD